MENNLNIFIQSNPHQKIAADVARYCLYKNGYENVEIINLYDNKYLKNCFGKKFIRNGKLVTFEPNDLQSFTLLRFFPPKICNSNYCLVIDPDVFSVKKFENMFIKNLDNTKQVFCTTFNNEYRSEVMLIRNKNFNLWDFNTIINDLFSLKIDYGDLINLKIFDDSLIGTLNNNMNSLDILDSETILLHTTNRLTQPWKLDLDIDFKVYASKLNIIKNFVKKTFGLKYNKKLISRKYIRHENSEVLNFVSSSFKQAYQNNFITRSDLKYSVEKKFISKKFLYECDIEI